MYMKRFLLVIFLTSATFLGFAQDVSKKMSASTQLFLKELKGEISLTNPDAATKQQTTNKGQRAVTLGKNHGRVIAAPDTIDGKVYISAFIRMDDNKDVSALEALGVQVQCKFANGLITANIPVDKIKEVAEISNVRRVNVAKLMRPLTNKAREATNVDDVLTNSTDAIRAGLSNKYDGSGVVLGVIDTGIDFQHKAFKDKNGNSRIKRAYVYNGSSATEYTEITSSSPTTDDNSEDHGTHTSSTAGGSSVIVSGSSVTVTDDHANASYGGMAPGADLYLAGINGLEDTYLANAFQKICDYADEQGKPVVVSNSWGSQWGPHDGTGDFADICHQYFNDNKPNHICLFAASNDAGGGGFHISGNATSSNPLGARLVCSSTLSKGPVTIAWPRSNISNMKCRIIVYSSKGLTTTIDVNPTSDGAYISNSNYWNGYLYAISDQSSEGKNGIILYGQNFSTKSSVYIGVQFYPSNGSSVIDAWTTWDRAQYSNSPSLSGYTWTKGSDDNCVSDEATFPDVISVGAYVSKNSVTDHNNSTHTLDYYTMGDIAYFSSYATANQTPTGEQYPWITAPGATVVSAVNHLHTSGSYSYINDNMASYGMYRVNNDQTNPYGSMEGTSMATPVAAGIVALWLQAANEAGKTLTTSEVKEVMKETAINDNYTTTGSNATHFGNGKIDALAGIQYILGAASVPTIKATPTELTFSGYATQQQSQVINVTGLNLEGNITVTKSGSNTFSVDKTSITQTDGSASAELTVTWAPTTEGTQTGTITLASSNAESVTISLTGTAEAATPTIIAETSLNFTAALDREVTKTVTVTGRFLTDNVTIALTDENHVFTVDQNSITVTEEGTTFSVTFKSAEEGTFTGSLLLSSNGAEPVSITLTATARDGGTASDAYLNIAKYDTMDEAGWNTTYVDNLYKYTLYEDEEVAWLTLPVYGAWVGVYYNHPQTWIETSLTNQTAYAGMTWNYTPTVNTPYLGSSAYFTTASARVMGYNSGTNTTQKAVSFYVTNTTAVKALARGAAGASTTYPAALKVYECTVNADGSLTASTTAVKSDSNPSTSTSETFSLDCTGLDETKIYKVEASVYRGYIYEIGFQTPIVVEKIPTITAEPTELDFGTIYATTQTSQTVTVKGKYLEGDVQVTVDDETGSFTVNKESLTAEEAKNGTEVEVTFQPAEAGTYNATITLTSSNAESVTINLTGTAEAATPMLFADPTSLQFSSNIDTPASKTITVTGRFLAEDVAITLTDSKNVFSVEPTTLSAGDITSEGVELTVTFNSSEEGEFTGTITLSSEGAEPVTINLSASANNGGTASDPYLNIAKYETIDEAGWNTSYVNNLYKYTPYEDEEVAWLTLPIYGGFVGASYATESNTFNGGHPQAWIETNITNTWSNPYTGTTWTFDPTSSDPFLGSSSYFESATARAIGSNSKRGTTTREVSFYVTNTTAVKLYGKHANSTDTSYPTALYVYECTLNEDGSLTASTTAVKSDTYATANGTANLSATDLDASKIYKVVASQARGYLYEIGFQTPLKKSVIGDVNRDGIISVSDVMAIVDIVLGVATIDNNPNNYDFEAAEVNRDGSISVTDVMALVDILLLN